MASELEQRLGYNFQAPELLKLSLTHKSYAFQFRPPEKYNEVLEYLGDAVLDLVLSEFLIEVYPDNEEGSLSKKRASLVNEGVLAEVASNLKIQDFLLLGRGELQTGGSQKKRILASTYEALVGAIFKDGGYEAARAHVRSVFKDLVHLRSDQEFLSDYKSRLQELVQTDSHETPFYEEIQVNGPAHEREFVVGVKIKGLLVSEGKGRSKKQAEQEAARSALEKYEQLGVVGLQKTKASGRENE